MKTALIAQLLYLGTESWGTEAVTLKQPDEVTQLDLSADAQSGQAKTIVINQYNGNGGAGGNVGGGWRGGRRCAKGKAGKKCRQARRAARVGSVTGPAAAGKDGELSGDFYRLTTRDSWMLKKLEYQQVGEVEAHIEASKADDDDEAFSGPPADVDDWDFEKIASGEHKITWDFVGGSASFQGMVLRKIPDFDFEIAFDFKTQQRGNVGFFSICKNWDCKGGHDRHIGLKNGRPYVRVWPGKGWQPAGKYAGYNDGHWHSLKLTVLWDGGQTLSIDDVTVGTNAHNYSRFNWKDTICFGKSADLSHKFTGSLRNFSYKSVDAIAEEVAEEAEHSAGPPVVAAVAGKLGVPDAFWSVTTAKGKGAGWGAEDGDEKLVIFSTHGKMLTMHNGKGRPMRADRTKIGPWEKFGVQKNDDGTLSFIAWNGKFVTCNPPAQGNTMTAAATAVGPNEKFTMTSTSSCDGDGEEPGEGCAVIKSVPAGSYVYATERSELLCGSPSPGSEQKFFGWKTQE